MRCIVMPATQHIYKECIEKGYLTTFIDAGCAVSTPTCGPCLGGHMGVMANGEKCVATTNRNFVGRMGGITSEIYLASPAVAAASAVADCLTRHDWARLRSIAQSQVPAIRLVAYHTPDEGFVACQAFEYVELEERPLTELHIVRSGHEA